jgi:hypothetical protein
MIYNILTNLARLHRNMSFSANSLFKTLMPAWNVTWRLVEDGKFVIQASCPGDWNMIMEDGPWIFRDYDLCVEKYDDFHCMKLSSWTASICG